MYTEQDIRGPMERVIEHIWVSHASHAQKSQITT